ncbi:MAG: hypothetical protein ACREPG_08900 [Candidatus Binatia bacterium]
MSPPSKKIPIGLARVRKELPPPGKIFKSKKKDRRKHAKDELRQEMKQAITRKPS